MTAHALVTGTLWKAPETKTSKTGRKFTDAFLRSKDGDVTNWWRVTAFSEPTQAELQRLDAGDSVSVQGVMQAGIWVPDGGEPRLALSIVADAVTALRQEPKKPPQAAYRQRPTTRRRTARAVGADEPDPDDDISDLWKEPES